MSLSTDKTYLVLNYISSPVAVSTLRDSILIGAGTPEQPSTWSFRLEELYQINNKCNCFRTGRLRFEPEYEAELYEELRIKNWEDILFPDRIADMILNPSLSKLQTLINNTDPSVFEMIYGTFIGLKNAGHNINASVEKAIRERNKEFQNKHRTTSIRLEDSLSKAKMSDAVNEVATLRAQMAEMTAMMNEMRAALEAKNVATISDEPMPAPADAVSEPVVPTPKPKSTKGRSAKSKTPENKE